MQIARYRPKRIGFSMAAAPVRLPLQTRCCEPVRFQAIESNTLLSVSASSTTAAPTAAPTTVSARAVIAALVVLALGRTALPVLSF